MSPSPGLDRREVDATDVNLPPSDMNVKQKFRVTEDGELVPALDERGRELPDPVPLAPPVGYKKQPSLFELVRTMVKSERLRAEVESAGYETFEDADDFVIGDDYDPRSPYENEFEGLPLSELRQKLKDGDAAEAEMRKRFEANAKPKDGGAQEAPARPSGEPVDPPVAD